MRTEPLPRVQGSLVARRSGGFSAGEVLEAVSPGCERLSLHHNTERGLSLDHHRDRLLR